MNDSAEEERRERSGSRRRLRGKPPGRCLASYKPDRATARGRTLGEVRARYGGPSRPAANVPKACVHSKILFQIRRQPAGLSLRSLVFSQSDRSNAENSTSYLVLTIYVAGRPNCNRIDLDFRRPPQSPTHPVSLMACLGGALNWQEDSAIWGHTRRPW
jgi:hypothetical protein